MTPLYPRVIIEMIEEEEKTASGIIVQKQEKEEPQQGYVKAIYGADCIVNVNDRVIVKKWCGEDYDEAGKRMKVCDETDILALCK